MNNQLQNACKTLRLAHVAKIYENIPFDDSTQFLEALFLKEIELREKVKVERLIKKATFIQKKSFASFE